MKIFIKNNCFIILAFLLFIVSVISFVFVLFKTTYYWPMPVMVLSSLFAIILFIISILRLKRIGKVISIIGLCVSFVCFLPFSIFSTYAINMGTYVNYLHSKAEEKMKQKFGDPILFINSYHSSNYYVTLDTTINHDEKYYDDNGNLKSRILETKFEKNDYSSIEYDNHSFFVCYLDVNNTHASLTIFDNGIAVLKANITSNIMFFVLFYHRLESFFAFDAYEFDSLYLIAKSVVESDV